GKLLAVEKKQGAIGLCDAATGKEIHLLPDTECCTNSLVFSPDGKILVSTHNDYKVRLWNVATGKELYQLEGDPKFLTTRMAFSPDGTTIATGADYIIRRWATNSGKEIRPLQGQLGPVGAVAVFPQGNRVATGNTPGGIQLWDPTTGRNTGHLQ